MLRVARILFTLCSALSLLLLLAVLVLWPLSYRCGPKVTRHGETWWWRVEPRGGRLHVVTSVTWGSDQRRSENWEFEWDTTLRSLPSERGWSYADWRYRRRSFLQVREGLGVHYDRWDMPSADGAEYQRRLRFPCAYLAALLSVAPAAWLASWGRRRRAVRRGLAGRCVGCGYDLTGNASGVCPECGTPASAKPANVPVSVPTARST